MDLDFLQREYEAEWERRDQLQSAASTPLAVLTLLGSAILYLLQKFEADAPKLLVPFWILIAVAGSAYAVSVYMLVRSYFGYVYRRLPLPSQLLAYETQLKAHLLSRGVTDDQELASDVTANLANAYVEAVDRNAVNNTNRGAYLHNANAASVIALVFTALAAVPLAVDSRSSPVRPQQVELTHDRGTFMTDQNDHQNQQQTTESKPAEPTSERPTFPQNLDIRTGTREPEKKD